MPDRRSLIAIAAAAACLLAAAPAGAETRPATLSVGATVLPTCQVSTEARPGASTPGSIACGDPARASVAVAPERLTARAPTGGEPRRAIAGERDSAGGGQILRITITY